MCRAYAEKMGYQVIAELAEDVRGASGADLDLERLGEVFDLADKGAFDVLVGREMDRLARSLAKQLYVEDELARSGVAIEYVLGQYPDTPEGQLMKHIRAVIAEYERLKITERLRRGRRLKVQAGNVLVAGRPPYGYEVVEMDGKTTLSILEGEAETVRLIYCLYTQGDGTSEPLSIDAVVRKLDELSIPTPADTGRHPRARDKVLGRGQWARSTVHRMLTSSLYIGRWQYGKRRRVKGKWVHDESNAITLQVPAIVDQETWDTAQGRIEKNRHRSAKRTHEYLLVDHATCGLCARRILGRPADNGRRIYLYYQCRGNVSDARYRERCDLPLFHVRWVDDGVWAELRDWLEDPNSLAHGLANYETDRAKEIAVLRSQLETLGSTIARHEARRDRLIDLYIDGNLEREPLDKRRIEIDQTLARLGSQRDELERAIENLQNSGQLALNLAAFGEQIRPKLAYADQDFETRRRIVEILDLKATLTMENEKRAVHAVCHVDGEQLFAVHLYE